MSCKVDVLQLHNLELRFAAGEPATFTSDLISDFLAHAAQGIPFLAPTIIASALVILETGLSSNLYVSSSC